MAQQFIKIFDDTVLKQSVNQGYETQRTNSRLGKFTMGELAFTRDTARLFVGNYTNLSNLKDSGEITGGVLVGNKYLGLIDSKPLTHYFQSESDATCVYLPLSYEKVNEYISKIEEIVVNENGETIVTTITKQHHENPLFGSSSKFRRDTKNNGWRKNAEYNAEWDAYNGDYLFDVYNNALILFDKNIKVVDTIDNPNWTINNKNQQEFYSNKETNTVYSEEGDKENYSTNRTPLINVGKQTEQDYEVLGNENYPIYGNGYVIMRILEPDNKTLCYKERSFNQNTGLATDNNYSHNYIELKSVPVTMIKDYFESTQFTFENNKILLNTTSEEGLQIEKIAGTKFSIHNKLIYRDDDNNTDFTIRYLIPSYESIIPEKSYTLCLTPHFNDGDSNSPEWKTSVLEPPKINIKFKNALSETVTLTPGSNQEIELFQEETDLGYTILDPFPSDISSDGIDAEDDNYEEDPDVSQEFPSDEIPEVTPMNEQGSSQYERYIYNGNGIYTKDGQLVSCEQIMGVTRKEDGSFDADETCDYAEFALYDSSSKNTYYELSNNSGDDEGYQYSGTFAHPYVSAGHNYLKKPEVIAWGKNDDSSMEYGNFYIFPFVISPNGYHVGMGTDCHYQNDDGEIVYIGKADEEWTKENTSDYEFYKLSQVNGIIPDHAKTIVCELHFMPNSSTSKFILLTDSDWTMFNNKNIPDEFKIFNVGNISSIPSDLGVSHKMVAQSYGNYPSIITSTTDPETEETTTVVKMDVSNDCRVVEFPLYRDKNAMKFFNFCIKYNNASWVMRAIGYRA